MFKRAIVALAIGALSLVSIVACTGGGPTAASAATSMQQAGALSNQQTGIWVNGVGKVSAQPDLAILSLGVESRAKTVEDARNNAANSMNAVIAAVKKQGVQDKDIQTRYFNITPEYTYQDRTDPATGIRRGEQILVGYIVTNQVTVKVRALNNVGPIIDDTTKAGGDLTRINGISFTIDDPTKLQDQARELAVKNALNKAGQVAKSGNVSLGKMFYITENVSYNPQPLPYARGMAAAQASDAVTPISAGELDVEVTVQAAFAIQ